MGHDLSEVPLKNILIDLLKPIKKDWGPVESEAAVRDAVRDAVLSSANTNEMIERLTHLIIAKHDERVRGIQQHLKRYRSEIAVRVWRMLGENMPETLEFSE